MKNVIEINNDSGALPTLPQWLNAILFDALPKVELHKTYSKHNRTWRCRLESIGNDMPSIVDKEKLASKKLATARKAFRILHNSNASEIVAMLFQA